MRGADKILTMEKASQQSFSPRERAAEKQRSREEDAAALASGRKSAADLQHENEVFARLASRARVDPSASKSLG